MNYFLFYCRLEFLGDMILKFVVSATLFFQCPEFNEKDLTQNRVIFINNAFLAALSYMLNIPKYAVSTKLFPRLWVRPNISSNDDPFVDWIGDKSSNCLNQKACAAPDAAKFSLKMIADLVESVLGSVAACLSLNATINFLSNTLMYSFTNVATMFEWIKTSKLPPLLAGPLNSLLNNLLESNPTCKIWNSNLYLNFNWRDGWNEMKRPYMFNWNSFLDFRHVYVQSIINHTFSKPVLLIRAIDLSKYVLYYITIFFIFRIDKGCFNCERLEFLGDVLLDYFVTTHVFSLFPKMDPGRLSSFRSKLVCNLTFSHFFEIPKSNHLDIQTTEWLSGLSLKNKADLVENITGALWLEFELNFEKTWEIIRPWILPNNNELIVMAYNI